MISDSNDEYTAILSMTEHTIIFMNYTHINMSLVFDSLLNDPRSSLVLGSSIDLSIIWSKQMRLYNCSLSFMFT